MISGLQSPSVNPAMDSSKLRETQGRSAQREGDHVFGNGLVRRLPVEGVASANRKQDALGFTREERRRLDVLKRRDHEVRAHERAHVAAARGLTIGSPRYTLADGPDGNKYAIAGHVSVDLAPEQDPEATIEKAQRVREAALAPADPSAQDLRVAARASMMEMRARGELQAQRMARGEGFEGSDDAGAGRQVETLSFGARYPAATLRGEGESAHRTARKEHLAECGNCVSRAFVTRFAARPSTVLGVA